MNRDVWIYHTERSWVPGLVIDTDETDDNRFLVQDLETKRTESYEMTQLLPRNLDIARVDDLVNLPHLHEAAILNTLKQRYQEDQIYTYNGPILIAVNPFKRLNCYDLAAYVKETISVDLPHVYGIAARAYRNLRERGENQTILASGESGSGKTMTTKFLLHYYAKAASQSTEEDEGIEQLVLRSNPIMEAFGNAKTVMNDNSSRFGKFIRLDFSETYQLVGGGIITYLLEKVRAVRQNAGERSFHVFYQIAAGASDEEKVRWRFQDLEQYRMISNPEIAREDGVDDKEEWFEMRNALTQLKFSPEEQEQLFCFLSGLLALGNVTILSEESGGSQLGEDQWLIDAAELLGFTPAFLSEKLTQRLLHFGGETIIKPLEPEQVEETIETFIQTSYDRMFQWIVKKINESLNNTPTDRFIGVVDIFGFEIFEKNSLEQLQINYTNEYLQQQFNQHIFKLEQKEYTEEGIPWDPVDFPDNEQRLRTIHYKSKSLFSYLNDQCLAPKGSDDKILANYKKTFQEDPMFRFDPRSLPDGIFSFEHYAGWVSYCVDGFCHKNRLYYHQEVEDLVTGLPLPFKIHHREQTMKMTTCNTFKEQLHQLIKVISKTTPHYVRCLKPNDRNISDNFIPLRILQQLRYGGVLEAVKVSRAGYPVRFRHLDFRRRYWCVEGDFNFEIPQLLQHGIDLTTLQTGKTKVFLKQSSYDQLEDLRHEARTRTAIKIQSHWLRYLQQRRYRRLQEATLLLQTRFRICLAKKELIRRRRERAARIITIRLRSYRRRCSYLRFRHAVINLQRRHRRRLFQRAQHALMMERSCLRIQSWLRGLHQRRNFMTKLRAVITLQRFAREMRRRRRVRDMLNVDSLNDKILSMEQQLRELMELKRLLTEKDRAIEAKDQEIVETVQVSHEICNKMNKFMIENHEMKEELKRFHEEREARSRSWFQRLFG